MFLGVDGGGTRTTLCLVSREGHVAARTEASSSYYFGGEGSEEGGVELVGRVLERGVAEVCGQAGVSPANVEYAFIGLPGYGEASGDLPELDAAPMAALGHDRYRCGNDMICGWSGSLGAEDGINIISGTGSMTYGECRGAGVRVGGWGELFGDEGSAYWIAARGLNAFSRMADGRLPAGPLYGMLRERLELAADLDLVDVVSNRWQGGRGEIAALSRLVVEAAEVGDESCQEIIAEAAEELARLVETTRERLPFGSGEEVPVSYSGGVFDSGTVLAAFTEALTALDDVCDLREPLYSPVVGAALYAAKLAGEPLGEDARSALGGPQSG